MKRVTIREYYWFGMCVRYLQDAEKGWRIHDDEEGGLYVLSNLERYFGYLDSLGLVVTARASRDLRPIFAELNTTPDDSNLTSSQSQKLSAEMGKVRNTLEAELEGIAAYALLPKRLDIA